MPAQEATSALPTWLGGRNAQFRSDVLTANQPGLLYTSIRQGPGSVPQGGLIDRRPTLNKDFDDYGRLIQAVETFKTPELYPAREVDWNVLLQFYSSFTLCWPHSH